MSWLAATLITVSSLVTDAGTAQYLVERLVQGATFWTVGAFGGASVRAAVQRLRDH